MTGERKGKKPARKLTTDEALHRLFSPETVEELKRLARELDEKPKRAAPKPRKRP